MPKYPIKNEGMLYFVRGHAVVGDFEIPGVTQHLDQGAHAEYGHWYFVAESMTREAAEILARALGRELI